MKTLASERRAGNVEHQRGHNGIASVKPGSDIETGPHTVSRKECVGKDSDTFLAETGYLTDVEYTGNYYPFLAPAWLGYIAAINGYAAPRLDGPFTWCDLGCGKGMTALLLAAMHPTGEFHACDFNPAHIEYAEGLRRASGVANLRFHPTSFRDLLAETLPPFDCIVLHGVYGWVPDTVRAEIREFLRLRLKPGGLCMVSYNAMPGWAHLQPLRRMLNAYADAAPGGSLDRARTAFARVKFLADNGAMYFRTLPAAAEHLKSIASQDIRYVAHEYLTPHGDAFYFSEVADAMRSAGLAFAGCMAAADNYAELMVPERFRDFLGATRVERETRRDFIANTSFRQDLYAAQPPVQQPANLPLARFDGMAFCLTALPEQLPLACIEGPLQFDLRDDAGAVGRVHARLVSGAAAAPEIHAAAGLRHAEETAALLQKLVVSAHIAPCAPNRAERPCVSVNAALIEAAIRERWQQVPLACCGTGSAIYSEVVNAAAIESAALYDTAQKGARSVLERLRRDGHPIDRIAAGGEKRPATDKEALEYVSAVWSNLRNPASPDARLLRLLGILGC